MGTDMMIFLIVWVIGCVIAYFLVKKDERFKDEPKAVLVALWPITLIAWLISKI